MQTAAPARQITTAPPRSAGSLVAKMAERFNVDADKMMTTLKATAFRQRPDKQGNIREVTNEEMMALLVIADQYGLNPFTKEIFAYFDVKSGAVVPVVSVDGWIRIINERPELQSIQFTVSAEQVKHKDKICHEWMECEIERSDRTKPITIREYFGEVVRKVDFATPWDTHPNRMHRHKTLIQCARVAFGFSGIYDEDEAQRIIEGESARVPETPKAIAGINAALKAPLNGESTREQDPPAGAQTSDKAPAKEGAKQEVAAATAPGLTFAKLVDRLQKATDLDVLDADATLIASLPADQQSDATTIYKKRRGELAE